MYATGSYQGNLIVTQCRKPEGKPLFSENSNVLHFQTFPLFNTFRCRQHFQINCTAGQVSCKKKFYLSPLAC